MTGAVGMITSATQADNILGEDKADIVLLAREFLRQPYWPLMVGQQVGFPASWPIQYLRAAPDGTPRAGRHQASGRRGRAGGARRQPRIKTQFQCRDPFVLRRSIFACYGICARRKQPPQTH